MPPGERRGGAGRRGFGDADGPVLERLAAAREDVAGLHLGGVLRAGRIVYSVHMRACSLYSRLLYKLREVNMCRVFLTGIET